MKNLVKSFLGILLSVVVFASTFVFSTSAAGTIISFSKNSLSVGDTLTTTVSIDAGAAMYGVMCSVNYDSSVLQYKSGGGSGGAGTVRIVESPSGVSKVSYTLTFSAIKSGSSAISVTDVIVSVQGDNGSEEVSLSGASANVSVNDVTLSSNANLSALSLSAGTLSPKFNAATTSYTVNVKNSVTSCNIYATAADSGAKVAVSGASTLKIGKNTRTVTVTAPSGAQKIYTITINRSEVEENTSSETDSSEDNNNFTANIEGVEYTVATDISNVELFEGFSATTGVYNSEEVAVATDANNEYKLYYLKATDSDVLTPYSYDEATNTFRKLAYFTQAKSTYIYADFPADIILSEEFFATTTTIDGNEISCYANSNSLLSDFYYLYCYSNGKYGFYRYDALENVMQRFPDINALTQEPTEEEPEKAGDSFFARFSSLSGNAKIIIIAIPLLIISAIALLVLIIVKLIKNRELNEYYDDEDVDVIIEDNLFENISFGEFSTNEKTDEDIKDDSNIESEADAVTESETTEN